MDWEDLYSHTPIKKLHWYCEGADPGVFDAISRFCPPTGKILDIGTGPGTMAKEFAKLGYEVTATDISSSAISMAKKNAGEIGGHITFLVDDILNSAITTRFDLIHDRGCFHVFPPEERPLYLDGVSSLILTGGILLLRTFSNIEPRDDGPYSFSIDEIREIFSQRFKILHWEESFFRSSLSKNPMALFTVLKKK